MKNKKIFIKDTESDIKNCINQLDQSIKILFPSEDMFTNDDFIPIDSKMTPDVHYSNDANELTDDSDEDFVEVPNKRTKEDIIAETNLEIHYLGFLDKQSTSIQNLINTEIKIEQYLKENDDNKVLLDIMKDLSKEIRNLYLNKINKWIKVSHFCLILIIILNNFE